MKILMIAFEFPPLSSGGVHRAIKLAKYLIRQGVELEIVTVKPESVIGWSGAAQDPALLKTLPENLLIHRIDWDEPWLPQGLLRRVFLGDPLSFFWRKNLMAALEKIIPAGKFDCLLSTAPPFGVSVLALEVSRRFNLPWVADWRDPWALWGSTPFLTRLHYAAVKRQEALCLKQATISVATSEETRADWLRLHPNLEPSRLRVVYNSFDPEETLSSSKEPPSSKTRIVYVGNFYYHPKTHEALFKPFWKKWPHRWLHFTPRKEDWLYRSPYFFLKGLRRFAEEHPLEAENLEVIFAGAKPDWLEDMIDQTGTRAWVRLRGTLAHRASLALQNSADALLLTSAKIPSGRDYSIAGKVFEYFACRKTILGVLTDGAMKDLVLRSGLAEVADPDDEKAVALAIWRICEAKNSPARSGNDIFINGFSAEKMASQFKALFEEAARKGGP